MKKDNKGYSLVEMIIVLGIAALIVGSAVSFTGYIRYANSKSCAEKLYSAIDRLQVTSMSKQNRRILCVWRSGDEYYYDVATFDPKTVSGNDAVSDCINSGATATKIGNSALSISYYEKPVSGVAGNKISLDNDGDSFTVAYAMNGSYRDADTDTYEIVIESADGDGMVYTIKMVKETGKHFMK